MTRLLPIFAILVICGMAACKDHDHGKAKEPAAEPEKKKVAVEEQNPAEKLQDPEIVRDKELAEQVALQVVELYAGGEYGAVYDNADEILRSAVDRDQFIKMTKAVFTPLGARKSIRLNSAKYTHRAPGGPDGVYVILRFESSFENKAEAVETITIRETQAGWRLAGYFIK